MTPPWAKHTPAGPSDPFTDTFVAMAGARALISATQTGVIAALAQEPASPQQVAARLALEPAGVEVLLTALEALGYVQADAAGRYRTTTAASQLDLAAEDSIASFIGAYNAHAWEMLARLDEVLRDRRTAASHERPVGDSFWEHYIRGLFELSRAEHAHNAALVPLADPRRLLDVAGGHGGFAMAMCRRFSQLQATILDLPASVAVGERIVAEQGLQSRIGFRPGDALRDELGEGLDVISVFNLLHHLAPEGVQDLLIRARRALHPSGCLVIGETDRGEPGQQPNVAGAMSAIIYYASSGTRNYSRGELSGWLERAGFAAIEVHRNERAPWRLLYLASCAA